MKRIILTIIISIISSQTAFGSCPLGISNNDRVVQTKIQGETIESVDVDGI